MKKFKDNIKFSFSPEFQFEILRFVLKDKEGGLVLKRIKSNYLVLIEHSLISRVYQNILRSKAECPLRIF